MNNEITMTELSKQTGCSLPHIIWLEKTGKIPRGFKDGKKKFFPAETVNVILAHAYKHSWTGGRKRKIKSDPIPSWKDLL